MKVIDSICKSITYKDLFIAISPRLFKRRMKVVRIMQEETLQQLKSKELLKVVFFLQSSTTWEYDNLYWLMKESGRYDPLIVIIPYNYSLGNKWSVIRKNMQDCCLFCEKRGYEFISAYNDENKRWIDVRRFVNPDVVFFSFTQKFCNHRYYIYNFEDKLTLYCQYATPIAIDYQPIHNKRFHNLLWKTLAFTEYHHQLDIQYSRCRGDNSVVIGLLPAEKLIDVNYQPIDVWKKQSVRKKRIIWAPHHTIGESGDFVFSTFLEYADIMLSMASKYANEVQFAFKPHPALIIKLSAIWGQERADEYYKKWEELPNGQLETSDYVDLFLTSDAMIHDCGGFRIQYLCTQKPVMYLMHSDKIYEESNLFGKQCLDLHYHGYQADDIDAFINQVVIDGDDTLKQQREAFFDENIKFKEGKTPSERILDVISTSVWG